MRSIPPTGAGRPASPHPAGNPPALARPAVEPGARRYTAGIPAELLVPTPGELDQARARLARLPSFSGEMLLGISASSRLGSIVGGLVRGDVDWVAENLRYLLAFDQAARAEGRL
ncbi:hypothetical protein BBK14_09520 [Parafrankia soli]|uniref:Uncharacterized protein n=1 Tax=Parafrankia soli TaxID=2599596 RepID=A0A1S1RE94_9ACTN|nr:hypothetical protein [Parafrankia soli]OHV45003.1 hypothetical protein BBK14_09520 [Parafrankia soli]